MNSRRWFALGVAAVVATFIISVFPGGQPNTGNYQQAELPNQRKQVKVRTQEQNLHQKQVQEQQLKKMMLSRDVIATQRLTKLDSKQHVQQLVTQFEKASNETAAEMKQHIQQLQQSHPHMETVIWTSIHNPNKMTEFIPTDFKPGQADKQLINHFVKLASAQLRTQSTYESPNFPSDNPRYFVAAQQAKDSKHAVIAVFNVSILESVKNHQKKNLRLIPYPKEGKYEVESIDPDSMKDITVKTGHDNENASHYYEHEIVVTFKSTPSAKTLEQIKHDVKAEPTQTILKSYIFRAEKKRMSDLKQYFIEKWDPLYVEPHYLYMTNDTTKAPTESATSTEIPNDILFSDYQWNLPIIETNRGWKLSKGSSDVIVAVVDTGVDLDHPDLQGRLIKGYNAITPGQDPTDDVGHGTHVAGIISARVNNNEGIAGMTWDNKIMPVKVLDESGAGTSYSVAQGIIWAADHGAKVINLSLGNYANADFLHEAIKYAYDKDVVIVAATGNDNTERIGYPAGYNEVLAVSATDSNSQRASFSNYGSYVDVMAPGESIASTYPHNQYAALSGTSMASPHVAALAALIRSINPDLQNTEVMDIIRTHVIDLGEAGRDKYYGYGQIDVYAALKAAGGQQAPLQFWPQHIHDKMKGVIDKTKKNSK